MHFTMAFARRINEKNGRKNFGRNTKKKLANTKEEPHHRGYYSRKMLSSLTHANKFVNAINKSPKKIRLCVSVCAFFGNDDGRRLFNEFYGTLTFYGMLLFWSCTTTAVDEWKLHDEENSENSISFLPRCSRCFKYTLFYLTVSWVVSISQHFLGWWNAIFTYGSCDPMYVNVCVCLWGVQTKIYKYMARENPKKDAWKIFSPAKWHKC